MILEKIATTRVKITTENTMIGVGRTIDQKTTNTGMTNDAMTDVVTIGIETSDIRMIGIATIDTKTTDIAQKIITERQGRRTTTALNKINTVKMIHRVSIKHLERKKRR